MAHRPCLLLLLALLMGVVLLAFTDPEPRIDVLWLDTTNPDVRLIRDGETGMAAFEYGTLARQSLRLYHHTGETGYHRITFGWQVPGDFGIYMESTDPAQLQQGLGLDIWTRGAWPIIFATSNTPRLYIDADGNLGWATDNRHDIGLPGARPRNLMLAGNLIHQGNRVGFYGAPPQQRQAVDENLGSVIDALVNLGLVVRR